MEIESAPRQGKARDTCKADRRELNQLGQGCIGHGIFHLQAGSPAIDSAAGNYPAVTFDLDGQPRTDPKDKGADEFLPTTPITARPLTPSDVGPRSGLTKGVDPASDVMNAKKPRRPPEP